MIVSDDFERATLNPPAPWVAYTGEAAIIGGELVAKTKLAILAYCGATFSADQFSEATIAASKPANAYLQVFVRRDPISKARYGLHWEPLEGGRWALKFDGMAASSTDYLATLVTPPPVPGDVLRIEARGTEIRGYLNGTRLLLVNDGRIPAAREPGVVLNANLGSPPLPCPFVASFCCGDL